MRCGREQIDQEQSLVWQGMDHQMSFVEEQGEPGGAIRSFSGRGNAQGVETGRSGGRDEEAGERVGVAKLLDGNALELGKQSSVFHDVSETFNDGCLVASFLVTGS